ncbi:hypothetical protein LTR37_004102 [Vermiconidia calcicola]|uniref:Uncharacterized protein n=1 Tax=Vermiconidia calcicola TaxID=1690605 RepID=A0ACC3NNH1_9PEZI|nr:hypothetical protein LTR37_004102 [Vermiconidia calcicola]
MLAIAANDKQVTVDKESKADEVKKPAGPSPSILVASESRPMLFYQLVTRLERRQPRPDRRPNPGILHFNIYDTTSPVTAARASATILRFTSQHEVPYRFTGLNDYSKPNDVSTVFNASATGFHDATAEVERRECISDFAFSELFNYEAFFAPVVEGDDADAESALRGFPSSYELDSERSGGFHI